MIDGSRRPSLCGLTLLDVPKANVARRSAAERRIAVFASRVDFSSDPGAGKREERLELRIDPVIGQLHRRTDLPVKIVKTACTLCLLAHSLVGGAPLDNGHIRADLRAGSVDLVGGGLFVITAILRSCPTGSSVIAAVSPVGASRGVSHGSSACCMLQ
jgi:hypothetical protein